MPSGCLSFFVWWARTKIGASDRFSAFYLGKCGARTVKSFIAYFTYSFIHRARTQKRQYDNTTKMSSRYLMLIGAIPVCYFAGYAYREYNDPDQSMTVSSCQNKWICQQTERGRERERDRERGKQMHLHGRKKEDWHPLPLLPNRNLHKLDIEPETRDALGQPVRKFPARMDLIIYLLSK